MDSPRARFGAAPTVFVTGALALGIEIVAGRLLSPHFGSSLHQWAALIGVVLLAYMGGYSLSRLLNSFGLFPPLLAAGTYALFLGRWLPGFLDRLMELPLAGATVLGAAAAAGIPSLLWASVLPALLRRAPAEKSAGILAWSSLGNLAGAWGVAFLGVPELGTRGTLLLHGALGLGLAGIWLIQEGPLGKGFRSQRRGRAVSAAVFFAALTAALVSGLRSWGAGGDPWAGVYGSRPSAPKRLILHRDSAYQKISVWEEGSGPQARVALALNGSLQFLWKKGEKLIRGPRYEYYNLATAAASWAGEAGAKSVLVLGLGGGLVPYQLRRFFPSLEIDAFELDGELVDQARSHLPLADAGAVGISVGDGRQLLRASSRKYDLILLDTFLNSYVPFHLTTREFFELARSHLTDSGLLVANFHSVFATSGLLAKLEATFSAVFPTVAAMDLPAGTTLLVAGLDRRPLLERLQRNLPGLAPELLGLNRRSQALLRNAAKPDLDGANILTDDRNDTEQRLYETRKHVLISRAS